MQDKEIKDYLVANLFSDGGNLYKALEAFIKAKKAECVSKLDVGKSSDELLIINGSCVFASDLLNEFEEMNKKYNKENG